MFMLRKASSSRSRAENSAPRLELCRNFWIWRGPASGRGGSAHRLSSGRLEPRGGLPLRHLGLGAVSPPQHGAAAEPAERLLRSQLKIRAGCASPARPPPCHAAYTKQAPPNRVCISKSLPRYQRLRPFSNLPAFTSNSIRSANHSELWSIFDRTWS